MSDTYDWIHPGGYALLVSGRTDFVQKVEIVKVGKRDVVLKDGEKFNLNHKARARLVRRGGGGWDPPSYLCAPDDPWPLRLLEEQQITECLRQAEALVIRARREKSGRRRSIESARHHLTTALELQTLLDSKEDFE